MSHCEPCKTLIGQSGDVDPHEGMRAESQVFYSSGNLEVYTCRTCSMRWERFIGVESVGAKSGAWKTIRARDNSTERTR